MEAAATALGFAWVPSRKPFLKRRDMCLRCCIRPVPVVRLRLLFTDQLTEGKGEDSVCTRDGDGPQRTGIGDGQYNHTAYEPQMAT